MSFTEDAAIEALAEAVGIEPDFRDTAEQLQHVSTETKHHVLQAMGFNLTSASAVRDALRAHEEVQWHRFVAPIIVLRRTPNVTCSVVTLPERLISRPLDWRLELEGGEKFSSESCLSPSAASGMIR
jgi:hypothetical protein